MTAIALLRRIAGGRGANPLELLSSLLDAMPSSSRIPLLELLELVQHADHVGPAAPPPWALRLFDQVGEQAELSPALLGALSCVVAGYRPDYATPRRSGILGTPASLLELDRGTATFDELAAGDRAAAARVRIGALEAARWIQATRRRGTSIPRTLELYLELGGSIDAGGELERILWTYVVQLARGAHGEKLDALEAAAHG